MASVNSILNQRMKKPADTSKMAAMAKQSANGQLTSFSGVFSVADLSSTEKEGIEEILKKYAVEDQQEISKDFEKLVSITSEVKAINNQAALLHGERIKKAHNILTHYKEGAFTAWLIAAYGNRQTPYNLMKYYEFYEAMPKQLRPQIELMPRQAVYVLATRAGSVKQKQIIVENYRGESKVEMLILIRQRFPLDGHDKRKQQFGASLVNGLQRMIAQIKREKQSLSSSDKKQVVALLKELHQLIGNS